ncbi:MAG: DNA topoisomerase IB [Flavobacteriaceae bacterium]|nr:DNA topoisomerase IB [Flavobacteriaceae bacterium]
MVLKKPQLKKVLQDPEKAAEMAALIYITDPKLTIRRHRHGRGFYYTQNGEKIVDKSALRRFKSLAIPPAWNKVRITHLENGHLQVVGRDARGRKQYRYHPIWTQFRNRAKFYKMNAFGQALPNIRKQVEQDLELPRMTKRKCLALIIRLMEETHIRIGNEFYAKQNKTYGLSTLRTKHVKKIDQKMKFHFTGKKGKKHEITLRNKKLQRLVLKCKEIPGWELFQYYDEDGDKQSIDSGMVNDYIQELSGELFSAKDFRTWSASKIFLQFLLQHECPEIDKERSQHILEAYDFTANALGNTRNVCRKYYVHPIIPQRYQEGTLKKFLSNTPIKKTTSAFISDTEASLLTLLDDYEVILPK